MNKYVTIREQIIDFRNFLIQHSNYGIYSDMNSDVHVFKYTTNDNIIKDWKIPSTNEDNYYVDIINSIEEDIINDKFQNRLQDFFSLL